jgi:hypothetical protein
MNLIRKKETIKFLKLCLISPLLEQTINLFYLISLPVIAFKILHFPLHLSNYDMNHVAREVFREQDLKNISTPELFFNYVSDINNLLYNSYDQVNGPFFIPLGSIRLKKFSVKENCKEKNDTVCVGCIIYLTLKIN